MADLRNNPERDQPTSAEPNVHDLCSRREPAHGVQSSTGTAYEPDDGVLFAGTVAGWWP